MWIKELGDTEVFVFGSNLAGIHGAGAAKQALEQFDAEPGVGCGPCGPRCYAIPTKDANIKTLPLEDIATHIAAFMEHAKQNPEIRFLLTPIGCGLAGYSPWEICSLFKGPLPRNIVFPPVFWPHLQAQRSWVADAAGSDT